jgi:hypothetical protein
MDPITGREDRPRSSSNHPDRPTDENSRPLETVHDELGLLGLGVVAEEDPLLQFALTSKPEEYFSCGRRQGPHEVL